MCSIKPFTAIMTWIPNDEIRGGGCIPILSHGSMYFMPAILIKLGLKHVKGNVSESLL